MLGFICLLTSLAACEPIAQMDHGMIPNLLLENVAWSFAEPVPASPKELVDAVAAYHMKINYPHDAKVLNLATTLLQLDATYTYGVQRADGEWDIIPVVVRVDGGGKRLSYADILWQLHAKAHKHLKSQDKHYFEGLSLLPKSFVSTVPAYEVYLGS
jgi:hypothetical protein